MKQLIKLAFISLILFYSSNLLGQSKYVDSLARVYAIQGRVLTEAESEKAALAIAAARERVNSQSKFKRNKNNNRKSFSAPVLRIGGNVYGYFSRVTTNLNLSLANGTAMSDGTVLGTYETTEMNGGIQHTLTMQNDAANSFLSEGYTQQYLWGAYATNQLAIFGGSIDFRWERDHFSGSKTGLILSTGVMGMRNPLAEATAQEMLVLFPVGAGYIIPGDSRFWLEVGANALLNGSGLQGYKFDLGLALGKIRVGPSITIIDTNTEINRTTSTVGLQIGFLP